MAAEKEEIILKFEVDQGDALNDFEKLKKGIIELKEENKELQKAYNKGKITLDEFVQGTVKNEQALKRQSNEYNNLTKTVSGHKSKIDELIKSNEKLGGALKEASNEVKIHGIGLSDLTSKISGLVNPVTIAVGAVGLLAEAYSESTRGAKDLEFAQLQMEQATKIVVNGFANMVTSAKDGEGALTKLFNIGLKFSGVGLLDALGITNIQGKSKELALAAKELEDLGREELDIRGKMADRLEENAQLSAKVADSTTSQNERLEAQRKIIENLRDNQKEIVEIKQVQLAKLKQQLEADQDNEDLQQKVKQATLDISRESARIERMIQNQEKGLSNIVDAENKRVKANQELTSEMERQARIAKNERALQGDKAEGIDAIVESDNKEIDSVMAKNNAYASIAKTRQHLNTVVDQSTKLNDKFTASEAKARGELAQHVLALSTLAQALKQGTVAQQALAITAATVNTYLGVTEILKTPSLLPEPLASIDKAVRIAADLAVGLSAVSNITAAAGGGSFYTKGPTMLMVGDNPGGVERVDVSPISGRGRTRVGSGMIQMGGGGTLIADSMTRGIDMAMSNVRNMGQSWVSVAEINSVANRVAVKENLVTI